jgi:hypothetical protein
MNQKGYIAITSILLISALVLTITIGASLRAIDQTKIVLDEQESHRALALANACAEIGTMKLLSVFQYAGNEVITVGSESCNIEAMSETGNFNRTVKAQGTVTGITKKVSLNVYQVSPVTQITSWQEVSDF